MLSLNKAKEANKRKDIVAIMLLEDKSYRYISSLLGVSNLTISKINSMLKNGIFHIDEPMPNKRILYQKQVESVRAEFPNYSDQRISELVYQRYGIKISRSTVNRIESDLGFRFLPLKHKPNLTEEQKMKRILFTYRILKDGISGRRIIFSDESRFVIGSDRHWVWRRKGDNSPEVYASKEKYPASVMIFGAIGFNYKSNLVLIRSTINSELYQQILTDSKVLEYLSQPASSDLIFQQDGASCHNSNVDFIRIYGNFLDKWPSNSPDLNVIEHLWANVKKRVEEVNPPDIESLIETIKSAWDGISIITINNLVDSFLKRCALCLKYKGESLNGHFEENIHIPSPEELSNNYETPEGEYDSLVKGKFTEEEALQMQHYQKQSNQEPIWDEKKCMRLYKYIVQDGLSFTEAARRLKTKNVASVKKKFCMICKFDNNNE